jgi:hypothetical protein
VLQNKVNQTASHHNHVHAHGDHAWDLEALCPIFGYEQFKKLVKICDW